MKALRPLKAIRAKCLDCGGGSQAEVRLCEIEDCPLYPYRLGHNPARAGKGGCAKVRGPEKAHEIPTHVQISRQGMAKGEAEAK
jgi:hypothetical protein